MRKGRLFDPDNTDLTSPAAESLIVSLVAIRAQIRPLPAGLTKPERKDAGNCNLGGGI
jgi:hypothetical protein